jgi:hypothetical protein
MKRSFKFIIWIIVFSLLGAIYSTIYTLILNHQTKTFPQKIAYFPNNRNRAPVFFIKNLKYKKEYLYYIDERLKGNKYATINFPYQNGLGDGDTIYIRKYLKDSTLVEFYSPKNHYQIWGLRTGYIHRVLIHDIVKSE